MGRRHPVLLLAAGLLLLSAALASAFFVPPPASPLQAVVGYRGYSPSSSVRRREAPAHTTALQATSSLAELQEAASGESGSGSQGGLVLDISAFGVLSVSGEDRLRFLHNQLTNRFADARPGHALEAAYTTALGRCIDLVTVLLPPPPGDSEGKGDEEAEVFVLCSPNRVGQVEQTMGKYIFPLDRVRVARRPAAGVYTLIAGGGGGKSSGLSIPGLGGSPLLLPGPGQCVVAEGGRLLAWGGTGLALPGWTVVAFDDKAAEAVAAAAAQQGMRAGGMAEWEALRIAQGRPYPDRELTAEVTPLEAGLYHAVHLDKGCYLGQETIAKVANNKGERQRLYGLRFFPAGDKATAPAPGAALVEGARLVDGDGTRAGVVTSLLRGEGVGLAYIRRTVAQPVGAEVFVDGAAEVPIKVVEIPYATRTEAQSASGVRPEKGAGAAAAAAAGTDGAAAAADAAAAKAAEEARKAAKLEEMRKRLEAFQANKQKKA